MKTKQPPMPPTLERIGILETVETEKEIETNIVMLVTRARMDGGEIRFRVGWMKCKLIIENIHDYD